MIKIYHHSERIFEKLSNFATFILGNSIAFFIAFIAVLLWTFNDDFFKQSFHESSRDILHGLTFLSLFIIQKSFNHFTASLHLKINELVASHEPAKNNVINAETKTEHEINVLSKEYTELALQHEKEQPE
ncbi:low affinity iron permease family protein [Flavobacterium sp.]|uniref:low affinity iron permease family protein n=1 Tax=Flavobacterium sp. TaxID=239 RepID=UPI002B4B8487|nr:low affinity iron permease family protein [Flavobacterium sp.]HLP64454.1 low affinity iron permease family protein [Flavobacterium sp.]